MRSLEVIGLSAALAIGGCSGAQKAPADSTDAGKANVCRKEKGEDKNADAPFDARDAPSGTPDYFLNPEHAGRKAYSGMPRVLSEQQINNYIQLCNALVEGQRRFEESLNNGPLLTCPLVGAIRDSVLSVLLTCTPIVISRDIHIPVKDPKIMDMIDNVRLRLIHLDSEFGKLNNNPCLRGRKPKRDVVQGI